MSHITALLQIVSGLTLLWMGLDHFIKLPPPRVDDSSAEMKAPEIKWEKEVQQGPRVYKWEGHPDANSPHAGEKGNDHE
jgi:hypothetical protein